MKKYMLLAVIMLLGAAAAAGCLDGGDEDGEGGGELDWSVTINGNDYLVSEIFSTFELHEVTDSKGDAYQGVYLKDLLQDAGVSDLSFYTYRIIAEDGWTKEVTHLDMEEGILVEEEIKTVFPDLPGKYRVKDVVEIEPIEDGDTITVNGQYWTWMQPFDMLEETEMYDNESNAYTGIRLSDLINYTALEDPQAHNYTIISGDEDGYQKEVTWDDMMNGLLVDEEHKTMFPHLKKSYWVKDVVQITVV